VNVGHASCPHNRSIASHNRALCPLTVLLAACCCLSAAGGQWFDDWIQLPDSFRGIKYPSSLAYDSATSTVWVGGGRGDDRLLAIDSDSNKVVSVVRLPLEGSNGDWFLCSATATHTLFCVTPSRDSIFLIDCSSHALVSAIPAQGPGPLFYNPIDNKVYCSAADHKLLVIDAATNQVIKTLPIAVGTDCFCVDAKEDWVYVCSVYGIDVIDGAGDSVVGSITPSAQGPRAACYSSRSDRVYVHGYGETLLVMHRDSIKGKIKVGSYPYYLCYNSVGDKVYSANYGSNDVSIIRCDSNRVIATVPTGGEGRVICYDSILNRVYCAVHESTVVIDGATNTKVGSIAAPGGGDVTLLDEINHALYRPRGTQDSTGVQVTSGVTCQPLAFVPTLGAEHPATACWNSLRNKVYVACQGDQPRLAVINGSTNGVLGWVLTGGRPCALAYYRPLDRIYSANRGTASVAVVDCAADSAIASISLGSEPVALLGLPEREKLYCLNKGSSTSTVSVIDPYTNSVTKTISTGGAGACAIAYSTQSDKVYCVNSTSGTIGVIDQPTDSLVRTIRVKNDPSGIAYSPTSDRLFCTHAWGDTVLAIDCRTDSVVARIYVPYQHDIGYDTDNDWVYCSKMRLVTGGHYLYYCWGITVVNCATNGVVWSSDLPGSPNTSLPNGRFEFAYNSINHRMYCRTNAGGVYIYPGPTFGTQGFGGGFAWNERDNRMHTACDNDSRIAVIRDLGGGVEENPTPQSAARRPAATIVRGVLFLSEASNHKPQAASLLDIGGRKVMDLKPGANDVRALAPGVYFVREAQAQAQAQAIRKVVITR